MESGEQDAYQRKHCRDLGLGVDAFKTHVARNGVNESSIEATC